MRKLLIYYPLLFLIIILIDTTQVYAQLPQVIETKPPPYAVDTPSGAVEITATLNVDIPLSELLLQVWNTAIPGVEIPGVWRKENPDVLTYEYPGPIFYEDRRYNLVFTPYEPLDPATSHGVSIYRLMGDFLYYTWYFTTAFPVCLADVYTETWATNEMRKPSGGICKDGSARVVQRSDGIWIDRYKLDGSPWGDPIYVHSAYFYSDNQQPAFDMDENCNMAVGLENDYAAQGTNTIHRVLRVFDFNGDLILAKDYNSVLDLPLNYWPLHEMQQDSGGVDLDMDNGQILFGWQEPICYQQCWDQGSSTCIPAYTHFCDNYIKAELLDLDGSNVIPLGESNASNVWHYPAGITVSVHPDPALENWSIGNCGGSAYLCPYHLHVSLAGGIAAVNYIEFSGNTNGSCQYCGKDNLVSRLFDAYTGNAISGPKLVNETISEGYDRWNIQSATNSFGHGVYVWMKVDGANMSDIYLRTYNNSGDFTSGEFRANELTANDQISPGVAWINDMEFLVVWASNNSGFEVFGRTFDASGNPISDSFRLNPENNYTVDWEEEHNWSISTEVVSTKIRPDCNMSGDCYVAFDNQNYHYIDPRSAYPYPAVHGRGNAVQDRLIITSELDSSGQGTILLPEEARVGWSIYGAIGWADIMEPDNGDGIDIQLSSGWYPEIWYMNRWAYIDVKAGGNCGNGKSIVNGGMAIFAGVTSIKEGTLVIKEYLQIFDGTLVIEGGTVIVE